MNSHRSHASHSQVRKPRGAVTWVNVGLAILALGLLMYYVTQMNLLASRTWQMRDLQDQLTKTHQQRDEIVAQQSALDDRAVLEQLAVGQGLVPAGSVVYLVQPGEVAVR